MAKGQIAMKILIKVIENDTARVRVNKVDTDFWFKEPAQLRHFVMKTTATMRAKGHVVELKRVKRKLV